jgi:AmmeMemoRadiSam system protein B
MLGDVGELPSMGRPVVLVEPHAGYVYSGRVAAHGYSLLEHLSIDTVVVISPSHMEYFPFVSVFDGDAYETPLGLIPVDKATANDIASADPILKLSDSGHIQSELASREHALEVQVVRSGTRSDRYSNAMASLPSSVPICLTSIPTTWRWRWMESFSIS